MVVISDSLKNIVFDKKKINCEDQNEFNIATITIPH